MSFLKNSLPISRRIPSAVDHRLFVPLNDAAAPFVDAATGAVGNFTVSNGTPTAGSPGIIDGYVLFDRNSGLADEALVGPANPSFTLTDTDGYTATEITLMAWIYPTDNPTTAGYVVGKQRNTTYSADVWVLGLGLSGTRLVLANGQSITQISAGAAAPLNEWSHIACTYTPAGLTTYLNAAVQGSNADTSGLSWGAAAEQARPWWIGNSHLPTGINRRGFVGRVEDVRVLDRAMTQAELQSIVARGWLKNS
jgi:hypothetical protein